MNRRFVTPWLFLGLGLAACGGSTSGDGGGGGNAGSGGVGAAFGAGGSGAFSGSSGSGAAAGNAGTGGAAGNGFADCTGPGQCELFANNCCGGYCGDYPISGFTAINAAKHQQYMNQVCTNDIACPGCASQPEPNYLAVCRQGTCQAVDLRSDSLSACSTAADCRLRWGMACCESCSSEISQLVALNKNADLAGELCDPLAGACPPCAPEPYPAGVVTACNAGHCEVAYLDSDP